MTPEQRAELRRIAGVLDGCKRALTKAVEYEERLYVSTKVGLGLIAMHLVESATALQALAAEDER